MLLTIIRYTPTWVWALLAGLLLLGLWQTRPRRVARAQLIALPLALSALGVWSLAPGFATRPLSMLAWAAGLALCAAAGRRLPRPPGAFWHGDAARLQLPGSWLPLALIVAIFGLRYTISVGQVLHPGWRSDPAVVLAIALLYGAISGLLLGRAIGLLQLTQPAPTIAADGTTRSA